MGYELIDLILRQFAARNKLHLYTHAKDVSARAFDYSPSRWQMWITDPDDSGNVIVRISQGGKKETIQEFPAHPENLNEVLEMSHKIIMSNIG